MFEMRCRCLYTWYIKVKEKIRVTARSAVEQGHVEKRASKPQTEAHGHERRVSNACLQDSALAFCSIPYSAGIADMACAVGDFQERVGEGN
jgi:hypothetical protein